MSYHLGLLSEIELTHRDGSYWTLDLWVKDLEAQVEAIGSLTLFSPVVTDLPQSWGLPLRVPTGVSVVRLDSDRQSLDREVAQVDVVQIPGNQPWFGAGRSRLFLRLARSSGKPVVLGISSDRARTQIINATGGWLDKLRARVRYVGIRLNQAYLAWRSNGVFVVGEGLRRTLERWNANVHVGTASWIKATALSGDAQIAARTGPLRLCAAARLEPMKGIHIALASLAVLQREDHRLKATLDIAGVGPDQSRLETLTKELALEDQVCFVGALAYPEPFFEFLRGNEVVLFTNLNDEQPRLIFDAISQGCLIICPDSAPYRALGIPEELLYKRGDEHALAARIAYVSERRSDAALHDKLRAMARGSTIESMHGSRRDWISSTLLHDSGARGASLP